TIGEGWLGKCLTSFPARAVAFVGYYSYSIYLWHFNPLRFMTDQWVYDRLGTGLSGEPRWLATTVISVAATVLVGVVMARLIEQPFLRLRERFFPARAEVLASYEKALPISSGRHHRSINGGFALLAPKRFKEAIAN